MVASPPDPPSILMVAVWFGDVPEWYDLWLSSCRMNPDVDWLVLGHNDADRHLTPSNVHLVKMTKEEVARKIEQAVRLPVAFESAYKACDLRPTYWALLDLVPGSWDFWGHCDLDVLFGRLRHFVAPDLLTHYDRIFGLGHFSLYRNSNLANEFFRLPNPYMDHQRVLSSPHSFGFDEHWGVNSTWRANGGRFYEDESIVLDIDPSSKWMRRVATSSIPRNHFHQAFAFDNGRIIRYSIRGRKVIETEFMYIHFQKRPMPLRQEVDSTRFWITTEGLTPITGDQVSRRTIDNVNPPGSRFALRRFKQPLRRSLMLLKRSVKSRIGMGIYTPPAIGR